MTEYIEREKTMELAKDIIVPTKYGNDYRHRCIDPQKIAELPAADVVTRDCYDRLLAENDELRKMRPVVLCRDCVYSNKKQWYADRLICYLWNEHDGNAVFEDGFCNYGLKREES